MHSRILKTILPSLAALVVMATLAGCGDQVSDKARPEESDKVARIVSLGGTVTEIIYALGAGDQIVGADVSSTWPEQATRLPQVGYQRTLSAENILSLSPTLIIASDEAGPPTAIEQLRAAGVEVVLIPSADHSPEGVKQKITTIAKALNRNESASRLIDTVELGMSKLTSAVPANAPGVMFLYSRGQGSVQVSGRGTSADAMIALAGGRNVVDGYPGYKALTAESALAANPEFILVPRGALEALGGIDGLLRQPGLAETEAGRKRQVIAMDDLYLLGFGPRIASAVEELARSIHPKKGASGI